MLSNLDYASLYIKNQNEWGPFIDKVNGNDTMYIYIAFKNNINLTN